MPVGRASWPAIMNAWYVPAEALPIHFSACLANGQARIVCSEVMRRVPADPPGRCGLDARKRSARLMALSACPWRFRRHRRTCLTKHHTTSSWPNGSQSQKTFGAWQPRLHIHSLEAHAWHSTPPSPSPRGWRMHLPSAPLHARLRPKQADGTPEPPLEATCAPSSFRPRKANTSLWGGVLAKSARLYP